MLPLASRSRASFFFPKRGAKGLLDSPLDDETWLGKWQEEGERIICRHVRSVKSEFLGAILQRIWACPLVVCPQGNKGWYPVFTLCVSQIPPGSCFLVTVKWGCFGAVSKRASYFHGDFLMKHTRWYYFLLIWPFFSPPYVLLINLLWPSSKQP